MLLGNYSVLLRGPVFNVTGASSAKMPSMFSMSGRRRNMMYVDGSSTANKVSGIPYGTVPQVSWVIPQKEGAIKSRLIGWGDQADLAMAGGLAAQTTMAGTSSVTAFCSLVAGITTTIAGSCTFSGDLRAILNCVSAMTGTGSMTATATAIGNAVAALQGYGSLSLASYALGHMQCSITPFTELSPQSLAQYVWDSVAADNNNAGTMGEKLNSAGSGSSASDIADAVWSKTLP